MRPLPLVVDLADQVGRSLLGQISPAELIANDPLFGVVAVTKSHLLDFKRQFQPRANLVAVVAVQQR